MSVIYNIMDDISAQSIETALLTLGRRLRLEKRRVKVGGRTISDADLAQRAGVSRSTVARLWQGEPIGTDNLVRIVRALGRIDLLHPLIGEAGPSPYERLEPLRKGRRGRRAQALQGSRAPDVSTEPIPVADADAMRRKYEAKGRDAKGRG